MSIYIITRMQPSILFASIVIREIAANALMSVPAIQSLRLKWARTTTQGDDAYRSYLSQYSILESLVGPNAIEGRSVMEIGPGDNVALSLMLLAAGAQRCILVDRFLGEISGGAALKLYSQILTKGPAFVSEGLRRRNLDLSTFPWSGARTNSPFEIHRSSIEQLNTIHAQADIVFSHNVLEHLSDMNKTARNLRRILAPGGIMIHRVDYGPHDSWRLCSNPLQFLTVRASLWNAMGSKRGIPNRLRNSQIVEAFKNAGFSCETRVLDRFQPDQIKQIRPSLDPTKRELSNEDLAIRTALLIAR